MRAFLPVAIKAGANYWFDSNNIEAEIGKIEIALFDGSFAINNVSGKSATGKNFSLGQFKIIWLWKPLFTKTAFIKHLEINEFKADAAFYKDGNMNIAGLLIKPDVNEQTETQAVDGGNFTAWSAIIETIKFSDFDFCLQQYNEKETPDIDYCTSIANFNWNGNIHFNPATQSRTPNVAPLYINGSLNINDMALKNNKLNLTLFDINAIDIKNINVQTPLKINAAQISLNKLTAFQRHNKVGTNDAQLIAFDQLVIQPVSLLNLNNLKLGTIKLNGTQAFLQIDKNGRTDFAKWLPKKSKQEPIVQTKVKADDKPFNIAFDEFTFNTDKHVIFIDDSLKERFSTYIHTINLKLSKLDSHTPKVPAHVSLSLKVNKYGSFKVDADLLPFTKKLSMNGKGEISGLDLRMLAPLTKQYIGHNIKSGQLDAKLKLVIKNGIIASNIELALHHFKLKALSKKEAEELNSEFGLPLNSSLSLLRDRSNTIQLDIPVNGDITNPEFDTSDVIKKASSSAISSKIVNYYTPFGLVFAAGALFDLATSLNFEPVIFEANTVALTLTHQEKLNKLAGLMTERPSIHLTLCGTSNTADKKVYFAAEQYSETTTDDKTLPEKPISKEQLNVLKKIAEARSSAIKNYLVNKKDIDASRLIECTPEFQSKGIAGVKISI